MLTEALQAEMKPIRVIETEIGGSVLDYFGFYGRDKVTVAYPYSCSEPEKNVSVVAGSYRHGGSSHFDHGIVLLGKGRHIYAEGRPSFSPHGLGHLNMFPDPVPLGKFWQTRQLCVDVIGKDPSKFNEALGDYGSHFQALVGRLSEVRPDLAKKWYAFKVPSMDGIICALERYNKSGTVSPISVDPVELLDLASSGQLEVTGVVRRKILEAAMNMQSLKDLAGGYSKLDYINAAAAAVKEMCSTKGNEELNKLRAEFFSNEQLFKSAELSHYFPIELGLASANELYHSSLGRVSGNLAMAVNAMAILQAEASRTPSPESFSNYHGNLVEFDEALFQIAWDLGFMLHELSCGNGRVESSQYYGGTKNRDYQMRVSVIQQCHNALPSMHEEAYNFSSQTRRTRLKFMSEAYSLYSDGPPLDICLPCLQ